jgi:hypothetical protein
MARILETMGPSPQLSQQQKVEKNEIMKKFEQKNEKGIYSAMGRGVLHRFNNNKRFIYSSSK